LEGSGNGDNVAVAVGTAKELDCVVDGTELRVVSPASVTGSDS